MILGSGRAFMDGRCMIAGSAMTPMPGRTACVEHTCSAIVSTWPNRNDKRGPPRWLIICSRCTTPPSSGVCKGPAVCRAWNETSGSRAMREILMSGYAAQPPAVETEAIKHRGRQKQSAAKNLLDDLLRRADQVLAFLDDLTLPFTNNLAERDLRMVKVQQKIAGSFRSDEGATSFCRIRSYLSTMHKQGHSMLTALAAVFAGKPLPVAWAPV